MIMWWFRNSSRIRGECNS